MYDHLYAGGDVVEVGCWAHCRRYFFKCLGSEPELARHALSLIKALFKIERALATAPRKKRESVRRVKSKPLVDAFFLWCDQQAALALDGTPLAKALGYARTQRTALQRFLSDGRLPPASRVTGPGSSHAPRSSPVASAPASGRRGAEEQPALAADDLGRPSPL